MRRPFLLCLALAACADLPDLQAEGLEAAARAPYPALIPLTQALAAADTDPRFPAAEAAALHARAAALGGVARPAAADAAARLERLRARAAILRGPLDTEDQIEAMRRALAAL